ncbi:MAG: hypothetical protein ACRD2T_16525 [Thermoanaerobaculia bacterium]
MGLEHLDTVIAFAVIMLLLSLLITVLVQAVISLSRLRGRNLVWGLKTLIGQLDPRLVADAERLAQTVSHHPALTHRKGAPAVAIRREELIRLLRQIAASSGGELGRTGQDALRELTTLSGATPQEQAKAQGLAAALASSYPSEAAALQATVNQAMDTADRLWSEVNIWFDTVMDRTSERFKAASRAITVVLAFGLAFFLHIDSLGLLRQLSEDSALRAQLVAAGDAVREQAEAVLPQTESGEQTWSASRAIAELAATYSESPLAQAVAKVCYEAAAGGEETCPPGLVTREDGRRWTLAHVEGDPLPSVLLFQRKFDEIVQARLADLGVSLSELGERIAQTRLEIVPRYPCGELPEGKWQRFLAALRCPFEFSGWRQVVGILMTALFLSLGAPFWYNTLRKLADLRPIVARRVEGEPPKGVR